MQKIYLVCGVSGCGKSWASRQASHRFHYIPHDRCWVHPEKEPWNPANTGAADIQDDSRYLPGAKSNHVEVLIEAAKLAPKSILTECPFKERETRERLEAAGITVVPIFVIEAPYIVKERYEKREKKDCPKNVLTRAETIIDRAAEWDAFHGTSEQVLKHLLNVAL